MFTNTYGWLFLLIAMTGDILVSLILPFFYKGYSRRKMSISALGNPASPVRIPFNIWMLIEGILFLIGLPDVYRFFNPVSPVITIILIVFIAVFAVGACIFTCFFSVNESKDVVTTASKIHGAGSVIGFMLFLFVPLLVAILPFKSSATAVGFICVINFVLSIVFFALFVMSDKEKYKVTFVDNEGLWQRLNLVFMYLPLSFIAVLRFLPPVLT